jgi:hypothetical protein
MLSAAPTSAGRHATAQRHTRSGGTLPQRCQRKAAPTAGDAQCYTAVRCSSDLTRTRGPDDVNSCDMQECSAAVPSCAASDDGQPDLQPGEGPTKRCLHCGDEHTLF